MIQDIQFLIASTSFFYVLLLVVLYRQNGLYMPDSLGWISAGIVMGIFSFFPKITLGIAEALNISPPANAFVLVFILFLIITIFLMWIVFKNLSEKIKKLNRISQFNQENLKDILASVVEESKKEKEQEPREDE